jgi:succinate-acetate transporter protein
VAFGYWFIGLAAVTWTGFAAAAAENVALSSVLLTLAAGSTLLALGWVADLAFLVPIGAIVLVASAVLAWYTASAMMLTATTGRTVLPVGKRGQIEQDGSARARSVQYPASEPGLTIGQ